MRYTVFLKQRDGQYWAVVPLLPSCSAQGRTRKEVLQNLRMAIEETLADMDITTVEVNIPCRAGIGMNAWHPALHGWEKATMSPAKTCRAVVNSSDIR